MPATFAFPDGYCQVLASVLAASSLTIMHSLRTGTLRVKAGVHFPHAYATAEEVAADPLKYRFNCAQRAHANYSENLPALLVAVSIAGLEYPQAAATLGWLWTLSRVLFLFGYTRASGTAKDGGSGRWPGIWGVFVLWGTVGLAAWTCWTLVR